MTDSVQTLRLQKSRRAAGGAGGRLGSFGKPSALSVTLGLPLAIAGELVRCWAVGYSGVTTRGDAVSAPELVTAGPYAYVRNPLYAGNFLTAAGFAIAFTGRNSSLGALGARGRIARGHGGRVRDDRAARREFFAIAVRRSVRTLLRRGSAGGSAARSGSRRQGNVAAGGHQSRPKAGRS